MPWADITMMNPRAAPAVVTVSTSVGEVGLPVNGGPENKFIGVFATLPIYVLTVTEGCQSFAETDYGPACNHTDAVGLDNIIIRRPNP
jgi:hypothetical protein